MSQTGLESFGAYQKARHLFDLVVTDMETLKANPMCYRLVSQRIGSADSICANIEEGHGRLSRIEYTFVFSTLREVLLVRRVGATSD
jgi:four helix bundle protein